jgi:hypothetical protein
MKYYQAENTGEGFITYADSEAFPISGYPANIWVTENTTWAVRVGAVEKTKEEAQVLVDASLEGKTYRSGSKRGGEQITCTLP